MRRNSQRQHPGPRSRNLSYSIYRKLVKLSVQEHTSNRRDVNYSPQFLGFLVSLPFQY